MPQRVQRNGEDHGYELELARSLGNFQRTVAIADSASKANEQQPDAELREMVNRITKLAFENGFEKGWNAARRVRI